MSVALILLVAVPTAVGGLLTVAGVAGVRPADRAAFPVALATGAAVTVLAVLVARTGGAVSMGYLPGAPLTLSVDGLSAVMILTVAAVALLVLLFSAGDIGRHRARFAGLMLVFEAAVLLTATAATLPALLLGWEVMGATSYALIAFWWRDPVRVVAGTTAFLTTRFGDLGLYAAAGAVFAGSGSLSLEGLATASPGWRSVAAAGLLLAAAGKAAQLPFSFWLSRAMQGPSPVSALLHSAAMVAMGGYLLLRTGPVLAATGWGATATAWLGVSTALVLGLIAVAQRDLKQLLAASTAAQLGFVVLAAGVGATAGGTMHLVAHAATKAALFLAAGAWLSALGTKQLSSLRGAGRRYPVVGAGFAVAGLALAGLPPLSLWATKDEVLAVALDTSPALYAVGLVAAGLSAIYAVRAVVLLLGPRSDGEGFDTEQSGTRHIGRLETVPLLVLAAGAAVLGVQALPPVADAYRNLLGGASGMPGTGELVVSALVAVAGGVLAVLRPNRPIPFGVHALGAWLGLEAAARAVAVRPTVALARTLARFDDDVLDRSVHAVAAATLVLAGYARRLDDRGVDGVVRDVAAGARRLGALARRPQTGQVHQYYAQAVVGLAAAVVILLLVR